MKELTPKEQSVMTVFCLLRVIDSQTLTLLFDNKDAKSRFLKKAKENGLIKKEIIKQRERTTHIVTLYSLTKKGLRHKCESDPASFFEEMREVVDDISVFHKDEYSDEVRLRIAGTATAILLAAEAGAVISAVVFNRQYTFGGNGLVASRPEQITPDKPLSLREYFHLYLSAEAYAEFGLFNADGHKAEIFFYDALYVKQALSGSNDPKAARDYYKGRYRGIIQSKKQSLLIYTAPMFGMSWAKWIVKPEMTAIKKWDYTFASDDVRYSRKYDALLIAKNCEQFLNLYKDVDEARKQNEVFGANLDHLYLIENNDSGVNILRWIMQYTESEISRSWGDYLINKGMARPNQQPSRKMFEFLDSEGNEAMFGLLLDAKRMAEMEQWARNHPQKRFTIFCMHWGAPYYEAIMPDNVTCIAFA